MTPHSSGDTAVILALDQGTSSSRALVVDRDGAAIAAAQRPLASAYPRSGWVEQDALQIWSSQREAAVEALMRAGRTGADVAGIGITNQRETTLIWDRATSLPIAPAIVWQDRRTAGMCEDLRLAGHEDLVRQRTGLVLDPYFSGTKIAWMLDHVPEGRSRAAAGDLAFGTVDSWLVWRLTGGRLHVTDATNASRTLLYDIHDGRWDDDLLDLFSIPRSLLPDIVDSGGVIGYTDPEHLGARLPIAALVGDQQAALFGQACTAQGMAKATYGTGCFLLMNSGDSPPPPADGLLATVALQVQGHRQYAVEGSVLVAGAVIQWLSQGLHLFDDVSGSAALAGQVPDCGGVHFVPALAGLGAPYWDPHARGAIFGLTAGTTPAHIARAALEGVAFQVADLFAAIAGGGGPQPVELRADGGAAANDVLMQIQADVLGLPLARAAEKEATALGAAALAGLATGYWPDVSPIQREWRADRVFTPGSHGDMESRREGWRAALTSVRAFGAPG
jgi:glycerol kinase